MMNLTNERQALAWSIFQDGETYRDAQQEAADELIDTLAYAIRWNQRAMAQRCGGYDPEDMPPAPPIENPDTEADEGPRARRARDKAIWHIANGLHVCRDGADWLIPSGTRAGVIHRIHDGCCNCESAQSGHPCWHRYIPGLWRERMAA